VTHDQAKPVPLPSAALAGLALMGGVGGSRLMRRGKSSH
jgi:hypothetical protein